MRLKLPRAHLKLPQSTVKRELQGKETNSRRKHILKHILHGKAKSTGTLYYKGKKEAVIMELVGKRKQWKNQLKASMEKNAKVLASGIRVVGPSASSSKKQKGQNSHILLLSLRDSMVVSAENGGRKLRTQT